MIGIAGKINDKAKRVSAMVDVRDNLQKYEVSVGETTVHPRLKEPLSYFKTVFRASGPIFHPGLTLPKQCPPQGPGS